MAGSCAYLPKSAQAHRFSILKTRVAYRVWRRTLRRCAGLRKDSCFRLLDVGCGPGYLLSCLEAWFPHSELYGLDAEQQLLDFAGSHLKRARLVHGTAERLPFAAGFCDIVCAFHVLEHLPNPERLVAEACRILRPGGLLLAATPNPRSIAARVLKERWPGHRDDHLALKTPRAWREVVTRAGFEIWDDGTTGLSGFLLFQKAPLAVVNWVPLALFGYFRWGYGESYMLAARKV